MRSGEHEDLAVVGVRVVELDPDLDQRAHHRMTARSVVGVPAQVAVALHDVGVLDEDHRPVEPVVADPQVLAGEAGEVAEPGVVRELGEDGGEAVEVVDPGHDLVARAFTDHHEKPSPGVVPVAAPLDLGCQRCDLVGFEHAADVQEAGRSRKWRIVGFVVVEGERAPEVERSPSGSTSGRDRVGTEDVATRPHA